MCLLEGTIKYGCWLQINYGDNVMKLNETFDVFISYRRSDGEYAARLIRDYLQRAGLNVFVDFGIPPNEPGRFEKHIRTALSKSKDFLLLITPDTFNKEKMNNPEGDWIVKEIAYALDNGKNPVPVILSPEIGMPSKNVLPDCIKAITDYHAEKISCGVSDEMFAMYVAEVMRKLQSKTAILEQGTGIFDEVSEEEDERLGIQAELTSKFLGTLCTACARQLSEENKLSLKVLDVGCANGKLGRLCFQDKCYSKVYGIDINSDSIRKATEFVSNKPEYSKYTYKKFDIKSVRKTPEKLFEVLGDGQIKFDIIFCSMVLHHIKNDDAKPDKNYEQIIEILQNFKEMLTPGGYLIVNNPDDSSKLSYEDGELEKQGITDDPTNRPKNTLSELVQLTNKIPGVSDRYCGRATYYWLANAGFKNIRLKCRTQNTSEMSNEDKKRLFKQLFGWQQDTIDISRKHGLIASDEEKNKMKAEVEKLTNTIKRKLLGKNDYWLCSCDYIGIAKNEVYCDE